MKKKLLGLFVIFLMFFISCGYNHNRIYTIEGTVEFLNSKTFRGIEGKLLTWTKEIYVANSSSFHTERVWFVYPIDKFSDDIEGRRIKITYYIVRYKDIPIVFVQSIEILD